MTKPYAPALTMYILSGLAFLTFLIVWWYFHRKKKDQDKKKGR